MKKTSLSNLLVFCIVFSCCAQNKSTIPEIIEVIKKPIIDDSLVVRLSNCKYIDYDTYIINSDYVIYENCTERTYIYPSMTSFRFPKHNERGFFALDKKGIYFRGEFIKTDTTGFEIVGRNNDYDNPEILWKTKSRVYKNTTRINVSDAPSFVPIECFNGFYFKDKNYIYFFDKKIEQSDGSSVSKSCNNFCYDKNHVYLDGKIVKFENEKVSPINDILFKTSKFVLTKDFKKLDMDASTIKKLSRAYVMDKNHIYYGVEKSPIKPQNFKNVKVWDQVNRAYVSDGINVYNSANELEPDFDAKSFGMLPHSDFCYDKNGVYERKWIEEEKIVVNKKFPFKYTDLVNSKNTFITDDSRYIIYKNQAYDPWDKKLYENLSEKQIELAKENKLNISKVDSKKILIQKEFDYLLTKKSNKIYWNNIETIADSESFESLNYFYYKDKNNVYYYDRERGLITILGIDSKTVKLINTGIFGNTFLVDKNNVYHWKTELFKSKKVELLGIFAGYRLGCGLDDTPTSNYYLFKNIDGYWLVMIRDEVSIRSLGYKLDVNWNMNLEKLEIK